MRQTRWVVLAALAATAAWAGGPGFAPDSRIPENVVELNSLTAFRLTNCNVVGSFDAPQASRTCDLPMNRVSGPVVLREVQIHTSPYAEQTGQLFWAAQCGVRVQVSEDGVDFREIAKFSWPPGDFHGINHVLPVPIGMQAGETAVLRAIVGITSIAPDECRVEVKVYGTVP